MHDDRAMAVDRVNWLASVAGEAEMRRLALSAHWFVG